MKFRLKKKEIESDNPAIFNIIEPFFIIIFTFSMEIQNIFSNQNVIRDAFCNH